MLALGNKHECVQCGAKFYDLGKSPAVCPSCGTNQSDTGDDAEEEEEEESTASGKEDEDD